MPGLLSRADQLKDLARHCINVRKEQEDVLWLAHGYISNAVVKLIQYWHVHKLKRTVYPHTDPDLLFYSLHNLDSNWKGALQDSLPFIREGLKGCSEIDFTYDLRPLDIEYAIQAYGALRTLITADILISASADVDTPETV